MKALHSFLIRIIPVAVLLCGVAGCAFKLSPEAANVVDADEQMVDGCYFVGLIQDGSGWGNLGSGVGGSNSKALVLEQAAKRGATHVVFRRENSNFAAGRAYDCKARALAASQ